MRRTALLAWLLAPMLALAGFGPAAPLQTARIGGLELDYDPARWRVENRGALHVDLALRDRHGGPQDTVVLIAELDYGGPCSSEAMAALAPPAIGFNGHHRTRTLASGLVLHAALGDSGCRNWAPRRVAACVVHRGQTVLFRPPPRGCRGWGGDDEAVLAVLEGLRPR